MRYIGKESYRFYSSPVDGQIPLYYEAEYDIYEKDGERI